MKKNLHDLLVRERVIKAIRAFFDQKGFHEVITPVLNDALPLEENLFSFETTWATVDGEQKLYLPTSPESNLKKLLARGIGNCYSVGHTFRNLERSGSRHKPEFLMLEWYREDASYRQIMSDTKELLLFVAEKLNSTMAKWLVTTQDWPVHSLETLLREKAGISLRAICEGDVLYKVAKAKGYSVDNSSWSQVFDQIFLNEIEPYLPKEPFFLVDFPARISPLCQTKKEKPFLAERFEIYMNGMELGNGNTENLDAEYVLGTFKTISKVRSSKSEVAHPYDLEFVEALRKLQKTGKSYAGIGLGVERLAMIMAESDTIEDMI